MGGMFIAPCPKMGGKEGHTISAEPWQEVLYMGRRSGTAVRNIHKQET
jgi:hypothetical protein